MVVSTGLGGHGHDNGSISSLEQQPGQSQRPIQAFKKKRLSFFGGRDASPPRSPAVVKPTIQLFLSNKQKDLKKPELTIRDVNQAFAVYPERPDLIEQSSLIKVEGFMGDEPASGTFRNRDGWVLIIPEPDGRHRLPAAEMRNILIGRYSFMLFSSACH